MDAAAVCGRKLKACSAARLRLFREEDRKMSMKVVDAEAAS